MTFDMTRQFIVATLVVALGVALTGCGSSHGTCPGSGCEDASTPVDMNTNTDSDVPRDMTVAVDAGLDAGPDAMVNCLPHAATAHRAVATTCDMDRVPGSMPTPGWVGECETDGDCTAGVNGRCNGNGHDGWSCTYDMCFSDSECSADALCSCEGGFRSDANVCLPSNCRTDSDCDTGFCSPTLGSCGHYTSAVAYYCHTCEDTCVNDDDCPANSTGQPGYCAFSSVIGHWQCEYAECVG